MIKEEPPGLNVAHPICWEPSFPKLDLIPAVLMKEREAGGLLPEHNGISVFPQPPSAEQDEGGGGPARDGTRRLVLMQVLDVGVRGEDKANRSPEPGCETTVEDEVVGSFLDFVRGAMALIPLVVTAEHGIAIVVSSWS